MDASRSGQDRITETAATSRCTPGSGRRRLLRHEEGFASGADDIGECAWRPVWPLGVPLITTAASAQVTQFAESVVTAVPKLGATDRGFDWLEQYEGLFIRQSLDALEISSCEPANRYTIAPLVREAALPNAISTSFTYPLHAALDSLPTLNGRETGNSCCERTCCPLSRGFSMAFTDSNAVSFFTIERSFTCEPCCCWPLCFTKAQALSVTDQVGHGTRSCERAGAHHRLASSS